MKYDALFTPFKIGNMEVKNRFVMAPMGTNSSHIDECIANDEIDYFEARAKGGVGLIIMGCQFLNPDLAQGSLEGILQNSYVIPQLTTVVEATHRWGQKFVVKLVVELEEMLFLTCMENHHSLQVIHHQHLILK